MKHLKALKTIVFLICLAVSFSGMQARKKEGTWRPKVGVVLSGGGVKGAAHVSILKAIEQAGIPIDYIVGTSMGSIVGGLYAMGYSTDQLDSLFRQQDWAFVLSDQPSRRQQSLQEREWRERFLVSASLSSQGKSQKSGLIRGQNLGNLLARLTMGYHDSISFDSLRIPFACVATNLSNGAEIVMRSGIPATALRASMAIPGVFTPVLKQGMTLVDGGLSNNYPVDVARRMGADIVIGSTVQKEFDDTTQFPTVQDVLEQSVSLMCRKKYEENVANSDLCLRTVLEELSTMDFSAAAIDTSINRAAAVAAAHRPQLDSLRRVVLGYDGTYLPTVLPGRSLPSEKDAVFKVGHVLFENISDNEAKTLMRTCGIAENTQVSLQQIEEAMRLLRDKYLYMDVTYSVTQDQNHYDLTLRAFHKSKSKVGLGARFDTEDMASVIMGADLVLNTRVPSRLGVVGKLGEQYYVRANFSLEPHLYRTLGFSYEFRNSDMNINHRGRRVYNLSYHRHTVGVSFTHLRLRNFSGEIGIKGTGYDYGDVLSGVYEVDHLKNKFFYSAYTNLRYNSQDKGYYPMRGSKLYVECSYVSDKIADWCRPHAFGVMSASWETISRLSRRFALQPGVRGRVLWGRDIPLPFANAYGGSMAGKYVDQQLPFVGVSRLEPSKAALMVADVKLRYNLLKNHYVTGIFNVAAENDKLSNLPRGRYFYGFGFKYGLDTRFGPIEAMFSYSNSSEKLLFYLGVGFDF